MRFNVNSWNEQELNMHFIGPIFSLINFSSKKYNLFAQRSISGVVEDWRLFGSPDGIVASGRRTPKIPFFAFSEYKREKNPKGEPEAQPLAAMRVGQTLNEDPSQPIYGCYVIGHDWYFMLLQCKEYAITRDYSAITDDVYDIFKMLKALKTKVQNRISL